MISKEVYLVDFERRKQVGNRDGEETGRGVDRFVDIISDCSIG